jgi:hypothetical protein
MLHVDTFATHQWHCLSGLYRLKPKGGENPNPHRWSKPPTPDENPFTKAKRWVGSKPRVRQQPAAVKQQLQSIVCTAARHKDNTGGNNESPRLHTHLGRPLPAQRTVASFDAGQVLNQPTPTAHRPDKLIRRDIQKRRDSHVSCLPAPAHVSAEFKLATRGHHSLTHFRGSS